MRVGRLCVTTDRALRERWRDDSYASSGRPCGRRCRRAATCVPLWAYRLIAAGTVLTPVQRGLDFLVVHLVVIGCPALELACARLAPRWHKRHRLPLFLAIRLTLALVGAIPFTIPEPPPTSCPEFFFHFAANTCALAAFFVPLAWRLPAR